MRTLTVVTWFCSEFFDFLLAFSFPASLSSRAVAFLYTPVRAYACVHVLDACACVHVLRGGVLQREGTCEEAGRRRFCWSGGGLHY